MKTSIVGRSFGDVVVLAAETRRTQNGHPRAILTIRCKCGKVYETNRNSVTSGKVQRCVDCSSAKKITSGTGFSRHPLFRTWRGMIERTSNAEHIYYANYGGRGITVCARWRGGRAGFANFCADMGPKPSKRHTLDRIDNDGPYSPENCRWATRVEQSQNTRVPPSNVDLGGHLKSVRQWCVLLGLSYARVSHEANRLSCAKAALLDQYAAAIDVSNNG